MRRVFNKIYYLFLAICGEMIKCAITLKITRPRFGISSDCDIFSVTVSLTSYGRRVASTLPYTIVSLLRQTYKPHRIVVWLDRKTWNDENLPSKLRKMKDYGLTVRYCEDIKSYKKIIPTIEAYPNDIIITVDDDFYYQKKLVSNLVNAYRRDPAIVHCNTAHAVSFNKSLKMQPYNAWRHNIKENSKSVVFATWGAGCIFHKEHLYADLCNKELFMKLAPHADDVWLFFMAYLQGTKVSLISDQCKYITIDLFWQKMHQGSNLRQLNCGLSQNDIQINAIKAYYHIADEDIAKWVTE